MKNNTLITAESAGKTMTIKTVSAVFDKDQSTIRKIAKSLFPEIFKNGLQTLLTEEQVTAVKLHLGKNSELPKTQLEKELLIKQAMVFQNEKIETLQLENEMLKPKAELADAVVRDTTTQYSIRDAGKHLGLRQSEIFTIMRDNKLLTQKRLPTQKALDKGVLTTKTNTVDGKNRPQAVMTMENVKNFRKAFINESNIKELAK